MAMFERGADLALRPGMKGLMRPADSGLGPRPSALDSILQSSTPPAAVTGSSAPMSPDITSPIGPLPARTPQTGASDLGGAAAPVAGTPQTPGITGFPAEVLDRVGPKMPPTRVVDPLSPGGQGFSSTTPEAGGDLATPGAGGDSGAAAVQLAQLQEANPTAGYNTPYYAAYTNDGDLAGAVMVDQGRRVRLIDPGTGEVVAEGVGPEGAQQIVTLANAVSKDLGRKAQWQIQGETAPDQFQTMAGERYDPKKTGFLKQLVRIAAPLLGAAIPGLAPMLGAALGGFGGTLATGGNLKESLLAGAAGGIGNVAGGALSSVLRGAPIAWGGVNPLGSALSGIGAGPTVSGLTPEALWQPMNFVNTPASLAAGISGAGGAGVAGTAAGALANELAPVIVQGGTMPGLSGALGAALGSVVPALAPATGAMAGADLTRGVEPYLVPRTAETVGTAAGGAAGGGGEVEGVTVTPGQTPPSPGAVAPGITGTAGGGVEAPEAPEPVAGGSEVPDWMLDFLGQTVGGVGADLGVYGLAQLLGFIPGAGGRPRTVDGPRGPNPGGGTGTGGGEPVDAGSGPGTTGSRPTTLSPASGAVGGGVPGTPQALTYSASGNAAAAPGAVSPKLGTRGSTAPDIYPWRKAGAQ